MRKRVFASFSIRKRLPIRIFGSTVYETIRIPISPFIAFLIMVTEYLLGRGNSQQTDINGGQDNGNEE